MRAGPGLGLRPFVHTSHPLWLQSSKFEGLGFFKPLWWTVVASGGSISFKTNILDRLSLYGGSSLPPAGRNPQQLKVLDFVSLYGGPSLPPAGRNPQKLKVLDLLSLYGGRCLVRAESLKH